MTTKSSANELRALVAELKPRSPQEVMGAAASSNLMASMLTATLTATALVVGATFLMFSLGFGPTASQETAQANANQSDATEETANTDAAQKPATEQATEQASGSGQDPEEMADASASSPDAGATENAIEAMGIGEAAEPDSEPESLENRLDQILDGLE